VFILYFLYFAATCFGPCWPSSSGIHNYFGSYFNYNGSLFFVLLGPIYCICLSNIVVYYVSVSSYLHKSV
jgi:hypothetical protein